VTNPKTQSKPLPICHLYEPNKEHDEKQALRESQPELSLQAYSWNPEEFTSGWDPRRNSVALYGIFLNPELAKGLGKINQALVLFVQVQKYWQALIISHPPILPSLNKQMAGIQFVFLKEVESDCSGSAPKGQ
jgi:hypothetical protein